MRIKKGLDHSWKAWGHWNNVKELLDLFGWKEWLCDQATSWVISAFVGGGVVGMFAGALTIGSVGGVVLYALLLGLLAAIIALVVSFARALSRLQPPTEKVVSDSEGQAAASAPGKTEPQVPKSLLELFRTDFPNTLRGVTEIKFTANDETYAGITAQSYADFNTNTSFVGYFVPRSASMLPAILALAESTQWTLDHFNSSMHVEMRDPADIQSIKMKDLTFTKMVYVYHEGDLDIQQIATADAHYRSKGLFLHLRGSNYSTMRWFRDGLRNQK